MPAPTAADVQHVDQTYARLYAGVKIDRHALDEELVNHPQRSADVSALVAEANSYRDAAKEHYDAVRAAEDEAIREAHQQAVEATPEGQRPPKLTESGITAQLLQNNRVRAAKASVSAWESTLIKVQGLRSSYTDRNYMLSKLGDLWIAGYWSNDTAGRVPAETSRREVEYNSQRRRLAEHRRASDRAAE